MKKRTEDIIKFVLDECFPPFLRDSKVVMWLPFKLAFKNKANYFFDFKDKAMLITERSYSDIYAETASVHIQQKGTDLSDKIIFRIKTNTLGKKILDVGCGKGILAGYLSRYFDVSACDIIIDRQSLGRFSSVKFTSAQIENLPYKDNTFETVICTHTLEHVRDLGVAIEELRRIAKKRLILVIPKERPYRYTFNLHLNFFPYRFMVVQLFNNRKTGSELKIKEIDKCWYCQEDYK